MSQRFFGGARVIRSSIDRADPAWVHGRGRDPRFARLRDSRVLVLGCGSLGAPVALALAEAGVGRLVLADPDRLTWANVGRHPLGADCVDEYKAVAVAKRIRRSYPNIEVEGHQTSWEDLPGGLGDLGVAGDLVVSAIGRWASEGMLNEWHLSTGRSPAVVYGWTEAHACAGHAVAITRTGGCLECGFDGAGRPRLRVCEWGSDTMLQEPACGAVFQPYGPIDLAHVVATIAELAMDYLLGSVTTSTHRIWVDRRSRVAETGGGWTAEWAKIAGDRLDGGFLYESVWASSGGCPMCQLAPAA
jgi:molybdopterin/thiamine biosynthesis adenylyltransferase